MNREIAVPVIEQLGHLEGVFNRLCWVHWQMPEPQARAYRRLLGGLLRPMSEIQMDVVARYRDLDPYKHIEWMQAPITPRPELHKKEGPKAEGQAPSVGRKRSRVAAVVNELAVMNRKIAVAALDELRIARAPMEALDRLFAQLPEPEAKPYRKWLGDAVVALARLHAEVIGEYPDLGNAKHLDWIREMQG